MLSTVFQSGKSFFRTINSFLLIAIFLFSACGIKREPEPAQTIYNQPVEEIKTRVQGGCVELSWSYSGEKSPEKFLLFRRESTGKESGFREPGLLAKIQGDERTYQDCSIQLENYYGYSLISVSKLGIKSEEGKIVWVSIPAEVLLTPPEGLKAQVGDRFIDLSWNSASGFFYNLYRSQEPGIFPAQPANSTPMAGNRFIDLGLENGKTYYYCLRAIVIPEGYPLIESDCQMVSAVPVDLIAPSTPQGLALARTEQGIVLKWFASKEPDIAGYLVYRRKAGADKWEQITKERVIETGFIDPTASGLKGFYEYTVQAIDNAPSQNKSAFAKPERISLP